MHPGQLCPDFSTSPFCVIFPPFYCSRATFLELPRKPHLLGISGFSPYGSKPRALVFECRVHVQRSTCLLLSLQSSKRSTSEGPHFHFTKHACAVPYIEVPKVDSSPRKPHLQSCSLTKYSIPASGPLSRNHPPLPGLPHLL